MLPRRSPSAFIYTAEFFVLFVWATYVAFSGLRPGTSLMTALVLGGAFWSRKASTLITEKRIRTRRPFVPLRRSTDWTQIRRFERTRPGELSWYPRGYRGVFAVLDSGQRVPVQESTTLSERAVDAWLERLECIRACLAERRAVEG